MKFTSSLMPHQVTARDWCMETEKSGAIMCLDMGMGKTVVSLSVIVDKPMKTLVVLPLSLVAQWESEITTHTEGMKAAIHHGTKRHSIPMMGMVEVADVVLTTYNTVLSDFKTSRYGFYDNFARVIVDEAHKLKTQNSGMFKSFYSVFSKTPNKVLLTGTPVCNSETDLISLFMILNCTEYNSKSIWKGLSLDEKLSKLSDAKSKHMLVMKLEDTLPGMLPGMHIENKDNDINRNSDNYEMVHTNQLPIDGVLAKIIKLRQCANDARLMKFEDSVIEAEVGDKVEMIREIVQGIPTADKIVVFSQWKEMLEIISGHIDMPCVMFHGKMNKAAKDDAIQKFKEDANIKILYITIRAGSVGLNLKIANHAILVEPYFNAAEEEQAMRRVYRIGQKKPVKIYRLNMSNTVEVWMNQLKTIKTKIANKILNNEGTIDDLKKAIEHRDALFGQFVR